MTDPEEACDPAPIGSLRRRARIILAVVGRRGGVRREEVEQRGRGLLDLAQVRGDRRQVGRVDPRRAVLALQLGG
jgi:hypothetical protein